MNLGEFIRKKRKELEISVWVLGTLTGVSGSYISLIETGKITNNPSEELIKKLITVLRMSEEETEKLYELFDELVLPKRIKEKHIKERQKEHSIENNNFFLKLKESGIDINKFTEKQVKRLIAQAKLISEEEE